MVGLFLFVLFLLAFLSLMMTPKQGKIAGVLGGAIAYLIGQNAGLAFDGGAINAGGVFATIGVILGCIFGASLPDRYGNSIDPFFGGHGKRSGNCQRDQDEGPFEEGAQRIDESITISPGRAPQAEGDDRLSVLRKHIERRLFWPGKSLIGALVRYEGDDRDVVYSELFDYFDAIQPKIRNDKFDRIQAEYSDFLATNSIYATSWEALRRLSGPLALNTSNPLFHALVAHVVEIAEEQSLEDGSSKDRAYWICHSTIISSSLLFLLTFGIDSRRYESMGDQHWCPSYIGRLMRDVSDNSDGFGCRIARIAIYEGVVEKNMLELLNRHGDF